MSRVNDGGFLKLSLEVVGRDGHFSNATKDSLNQNSNLNYLLHLLVPSRLVVTVTYPTHIILLLTFCRI